MFARLRSVGFPALNFQLCFEFVFEVILPTVGIVLEAVNWNFARWLNVGCFTVAGTLLMDLTFAWMVLAPGYTREVSAPCGVEA
jgi:hypothetical protein